MHACFNASREETIVSTAAMMERIAGVFYLLTANFSAAKI
jgi:hypothetical protein